MFGVKYKCASDGKRRTNVVLRIAIFLAFCTVSNAFTVKHLFVPDNADIKSPHPIRLECVIEYQDSDNITPSELVAKWYLNTTLLLQWSAGSTKPLFVNNTFTDRIDFNPVNRTRVINKTLSLPLIITKKSIDLTGWYRCQGESFQSNTLDESYMVMYVPVDNMTLDQVFDNVTNVLNVTCGAEDVYPKPEITLTVNGEKNITGPILDVRMNENQLFDITATYALPVSTLKSVTKINCSIALPEVGHISSRLTQFHKSGSDDGDSDAMLSDNSGARRYYSSLTMLSILTAFMLRHAV